MRGSRSGAGEEVEVPSEKWHTGGFCKNDEDLDFSLLYVEIKYR